jgi:hypothetical protein
VKQRRPFKRRKPLRQPKKKLLPQAAPIGPFHTDTSLGATRLAWQQQEDRGDVARDAADQKNKNIAPVEPPVELSAADLIAPAPVVSVPPFLGD